MSIRVNLYPFPADQHLKRLYALYNMPRDWWSSACLMQENTVTGAKDVDIVMGNIGTPDISDAFLLDSTGRVVTTLQDFNKASASAKASLTEEGDCWAVYRPR